MDCYNLDYSLFKENLIRGYKAAQSIEALADVTLVCDDGEVSAHKLVLFTGSEFFQNFLPRVKHPNPYIYLRGIKMKHLEMALDFMYLGAVQVPQGDIKAILEVANDLKISGLTEEETPKDKENTKETIKVEGKKESANIVENYQEEAAKVKDRLDVLMKNLKDMKGKGKKDKNKKVEEEKDMTADEIDEKALSMLKKGFDEEGRTSWICKDCGFLCNDKSRSKRHVRNNHIKERRKSSKNDNVEQNFTSALESDISIETPVPAEIKRPRTRGMKKALEQDIESIEKNEAVESLNESFVEDMIEEHNDIDTSADSANAQVTSWLQQALVATTGTSDWLQQNNSSSDASIEEQAHEMMEKDFDKDSGRVSWICKICDFACNDKSRTRRHVKTKHLPKEDKPEVVSIMNEDITIEEETETESDPLIEAFSFNDTTDTNSDIKSHIYEDDDVQALTMMTKSMDNNKMVWTCEVCKYACNDKTRIRKHVKNVHIRKEKS